jgi:hypothetical protein
VIYQKPEPVSKQDVEAILAPGDIEQIKKTLVSLALTESDLHWV